MTSDATNTNLPMTSSCHLSGLSRWSAENHFAGLKINGDLWELDENFFSCCGGTGIEVQDLQKRLAKMCGLTPRWALLKEYVQLVAKNFPSQNLSEILVLSKRSSAISQKMMEALLRWRTFHVKAIALEPKGRLIADNAEIVPGITVDWLGCATCIWHDGIRVFHHLHASGPPPLAKWQRELQTMKDQRTIVWIERVHNLFDAAKLLEFDEVVSFAAHHRLPLWIDLSRAKGEEGQKSEQTGSRKFSKALDRKLSSYRDGPLEKWLSAQTLGRLLEVCELPLKQKMKGEFVIPPVV